MRPHCHVPIINTKHLEIQYLFQNLFIFSHSYNNAYQTAVAVIDNLLHSILQFHLALFIDHRHLTLHAIHDQFFNGLSKDTGSPYAAVSVF